MQASHTVASLAPATRDEERAHARVARRVLCARETSPTPDALDGGAGAWGARTWPKSCTAISVASAVPKIMQKVTPTSTVVSTRVMSFCSTEKGESSPSSVASCLTFHGQSVVIAVSAPAAGRRRGGRRRAQRTLLEGARHALAGNVLPSFGRRTCEQRRGHEHERPHDEPPQHRRLRERAGRRGRGERCAAGE
eukprot:3868413-Prymnesium_polylepis.1